VQAIARFAVQQPHVGTRMGHCNGLAVAAPLSRTRPGGIRIPPHHRGRYTIEHRRQELLGAPNAASERSRSFPGDEATLPRSSRRRAQGTSDARLQPSSPSPAGKLTAHRASLATCPFYRPFVSPRNLAPDGRDPPAETAVRTALSRPLLGRRSRGFKSFPFAPHERPGQADGWQLGPVDGAGCARSRYAIQSAKMHCARMSSRIADARSHRVQGRPNRWRQRDELEHPTVPASWKPRHGPRRRRGPWTPETPHGWRGLRTCMVCGRTVAPSAGVDPGSAQEGKGSIGPSPGAGRHGGPPPRG
jgi:hypothetical protein